MLACGAARPAYTRTRCDSDATTVPYEPASPVRSSLSQSPAADGWTTEDDDAVTAPPTPVKPPAPRRQRRQTSMEGLIELPKDVLRHVIAKRLPAEELSQLARTSRQSAAIMQPMLSEARRCQEWLDSQSAAHNDRPWTHGLWRSWYNYDRGNWSHGTHIRGATQLSLLLMDMKQWPLQRLATLKSTPGLLPGNELSLAPEWLVLLTLGACPLVKDTIPWQDAEFLLAWKKAVTHFYDGNTNRAAYLSLLQYDPAWVTATKEQQLPHQIRQELFQDMKDREDDDVVQEKWDILRHVILTSRAPVNAAFSNAQFVRRITDTQVSLHARLELVVRVLILEIIAVDSLTPDWYDDTAITRPSSPAAMEDEIDPVKAMGSPPATAWPTIPVGFL